MADNRPPNPSWETSPPRERPRRALPPPLPPRMPRRALERRPARYSRYRAPVAYNDESESEGDDYDDDDYDDDDYDDDDYDDDDYDDDDYDDDDDGPLGNWVAFEDAVPMGPPTTRERGRGMTNPAVLQPMLRFAVVHPHFGRDSDYALGRLAAEALYTYRRDPKEAGRLLVSLRVAIEAYVVFLRGRERGAPVFAHDSRHTPFDADEPNPFDPDRTPDEYATGVVDGARFALGVMAQNDRRAAGMWEHIELVLAYLEMLRLELWVVAPPGARWTGPMPYDFEAVVGSTEPENGPEPYVPRNRGMDLTRRAPSRVPVRQREGAGLSVEEYARQRTQRRGYRRLLGVMMQSSLLED